MRGRSGFDLGVADYRKHGTAGFTSQVRQSIGVRAGQTGSIREDRAVDSRRLQQMVQVTLAPSNRTVGEKEVIAIRRSASGVSALS